MANLCSYILCCNKPPPYRRDIKLACFGIDGAGKTFVLKLVKGENPRATLSTNGFSVIEMEFDDQFHLVVYDVGGAETIRDIWSNYYAEVHGIVFVVDSTSTESAHQSIDALQVMMNHPDSSKKPIFIVLNDKNNGEIDDVEFTNAANLQEIADRQQQMVSISHVSPYAGHVDEITKAVLTVRKRMEKDKTALQVAFCSFIDLIIQHYVYLSEGVKAAEMALKLRQQTDKENRRLQLMLAEHEKRAADIAALEGRPIPLPVTTDEETSPSSSFHSSELEPEMTESPPLDAQISQSSTKPVSPEDPIIEEGKVITEQPTAVFSPPHPKLSQLDPNQKQSRHNSRFSRIQNALSTRIAPAY